jgi:DNA polymerase III epsilon subunit-like protein
LYEQNVIQFQSEWDLLSVAWKWAGDRSPHVKTRADFKDKTDRSLTEVAWNLLDEADIVVGHNSVDFDNKKVAARFAVHRLGSPKQWLNIDTCRQARSLFKFNSNKLEDLARYFGLGTKIKTGGFDLWRDAMNGDVAALRKMGRYNLQDVRLLERVYKCIRPHMKSHPNVSLIATGDVNGCTHCGSPRVKKDGITYRQRTLAQLMRCNDCRGSFTVPLKKGDAA